MGMGNGPAILGQARAHLTQMVAHLARVNPNAPRLSSLYLRHGSRLGVRGDIAFAQALHETDYFRYGGLVQPEQNNFAGLGATGPGNPGASFATPEEGVIAHLQHLYAYASTAPLPNTMAKVDPRFDLVQRGSAPHLYDLNGRWAVPGEGYGEAIDRILGKILLEPMETEPYAITEAYLDPTSQNRPGPCTPNGCWQGVQGIIVHRTASPTMDAQAIRQYFNDAPDGRYASSQFVLDNAEILQLMPIGEVAYHTSGKNFTHLGIETCEHNWGSPEWAETYRKLVWLVGYLMRMFDLPIEAVTGHYAWDKVNRPYDPTHAGWQQGDSQATGLFSWNQFISDVQDEVRRATTESIPVRVVRTVTEECEPGRLINSTTYVPLRPYTDCLVPGATVTWDEARRTVIVELPPDEEP
ncbi:MAG: N-acetylmuramoyl-L-alanine amidase [Bacillota bacterium]